MGSTTKTDSMALSREDARLVDNAILTIRSLWAQGLLSTTVAVGDFLIEAFFEGSLELASSHSPTKAAAMSQLVARIDELPISVHQLRTAIRVAAQYHALPTDVADSLTVSHHERLLLVADADRKEQIAGEAKERGLSVRELDKLIRKHQPPRAGGRPPAPVALKWVRNVVRAVESDAVKTIVSTDSMAAVGDKERRVLREQLLEVRSVIDDVLAAFPEE